MMNDSNNNSFYVYVGICTYWGCLILIGSIGTYVLQSSKNLRG